MSYTDRNEVRSIRYTIRLNEYEDEELYELMEKTRISNKSHIIRKAIHYYNKAYPRGG